MKKCFLGVFSLVLVVCLNLPAFSAALPRITDICEDAWDEAQDYADRSATIGSNRFVGDLTDLEVFPGEEVRIYLNASLFSDANGAPIGDNTYGVTLSQLRSGSITVASRMKSGAGVLEELSLEYYRQAGNLGISVEEGTSYIKLKFADELISVNEMPFDYTIYLRVKGKEREDTRIQIAGTINNDKVELSAGTDFVDMENGLVAEAQEYLRNVQIHLGGNLFMTADLYADSKYYGLAKINEPENDISLADAFPDIEMVYDVYQVNLKAMGDVYYFDFSLDEYYVYDAAGAYLGTTSNNLPYSERYYLAGTELQGLAEYLAPGA